MSARCSTRRRSWPCSRCSGSGNPGSDDHRSRHRPRDCRRSAAGPDQPDLHRLPGDGRDRAIDPRGARRGRLPRRPHRAGAVPALDDRLDHASAAASGSTPTGSPRQAIQRPPNARNADRPTPSRSAASARPRARRSGAAHPAWSRSTASSATERTEHHHSAKLPSLVRKIGLRQRWRSLSASRTAASSMSTPRPGPSGTGR